MEPIFLFSVIIPTYNRAQYLTKTIMSVLDQHDRNFELLIIDDGSTDNTKDIIKGIHDQRIRYFWKQNGERAAARNFGVQKALGEYITFLDSDDLLKSDHLSTARFYIDQQKLSIFHLGYDVVNENGEIIYPWKKLKSPVNEKLIEGNFLSCLGIFIQRDILLKNTFNEDRYLSGSEDYELWLRLAARYPIFTCENVTAMLVNHELRSVVQIEPEQLVRRIELIRCYLKEDDIFISKFAKKMPALNAFLNIYLSLHLALTPASKRKSFRFLMQALYWYPGVALNKRFWIVLKKIMFN